MVAIEDLRRSYDRTASQYRSARLSLATGRSGGVEWFLRGTLEFSRNRKETAQVQDYGSLVLKRKSLPTDVALQFIESLAHGATPEEEDFRVSRPPDLPEEKSPFDWDRMMAVSPELPIPISLGRVSVWPSQTFILRARVTMVGDPPGPLAKHNLPLVIDTRWAISQWLGWNPQAINLISGLVCILPDFRARISRIRFEEDEVAVSVETDLISKSRIVAKAALGWQTPETKVQYSRGAYHVKLAELPDSFHFVILDEKSDEILDLADVYLGSTQFPPQVEFAFPEIQLERLIEGGENEAVEFKKEVKEPFTIVQSIVAFANTEGGRILVGVNDNCKVDGVDPVSTQDKVEEWIELWCDPPVAVEFTPTTIAGKQILVITVPKGDHQPYAHRENGVFYVRRGANDRPARKAEVDALYAARAPETPGWG